MYSSWHNSVRRYFKLLFLIFSTLNLIMLGKSQNLTILYLSQIEKKHHMKETHKLTFHFMNQYSRLASDNIFPFKKPLLAVFFSPPRSLRKNEFSLPRVIIQHFLKKTKVKSLSSPSYACLTVLIHFCCLAVRRQLTHFLWVLLLSLDVLFTSKRSYSS